MTRPRKQTVDWFPHSCSHGRTIFVQRYSAGAGEGQREGHCPRGSGGSSEDTVPPFKRRDGQLRLGPLHKGGDGGALPGHLPGRMDITTSIPTLSSAEA